VDLDLLGRARLRYFRSLSPGLAPLLRHVRLQFPADRDRHGGLSGLARRHALGGNVCKQVHDRGLLWKNWSQVRRGEEAVLWAALGAANYNYIIEWTFRDDGVVLGRVGATAANLPGLPFEPHIHNPFGDSTLISMASGAIRWRSVRTPSRYPFPQLPIANPWFGLKVGGLGSARV